MAAQHTLSRPGAELSYEIHEPAPAPGRGQPPLVQAHGILLSRAEEERLGLFDLSPVVGAGRRLVRYDQRGHGRSTGRPEPADYTFAAVAGDFLALAGAVSPDAPVDGAGSSLGAATVLHAAVLAPERLRRLVLLIPPTAWETRRAQAVLYDEEAELVEREGKAAYVSALAAAPPPPVLASGPPLEADVAEPLLPSVMRGAALSDLPAPDALAALPHPALILAWDGDPGHPLATAQRLAGLLPKAELHIAEERGEVERWGERAAAFLA